MAAERERFIVDKRGNKTSVVISVRRYRKLLEDLHDLAVVAERRSEKAIGLGEIRRRLKRDGVL
jgi:hypothetical protein